MGARLFHLRGVFVWLVVVISCIVSLTTVYASDEKSSNVKNRETEKKIPDIIKSVLDKSPDDLKKSDEFFFVSKGLELWQIVEQIEMYFGRTVMVFDDIKHKNIHSVIHGKTLKNVLDRLSWLLGCEYVERDGVYLLGSNTRTIIVLPSSGINSEIEKVFKNVTVKQLGDKIVVSGSERDVAKVKSAYDLIVNRPYVIVHLYAIEILYDAGLELGLEIDKVIEYSFSWQGLIASMGNPLQTLAIAVAANLEASADKVRVSSVIDTDVGLLSGKQVYLQMGQDVDRPIYSESQYGEQSRVISGYNTQRSGLILRLKGYFDSNSWFVDFNIENSEAKTDLIKSITSFTTISKLNRSNPLQILCSLNLESVKQEYSQGIPFFCELPVVGYLFRVTKERKMKRKLYFVLQLKNHSNSSVPQQFNFNGIIDWQTAMSAYLINLFR